MARGIAIVALGVTGWLALSALGGCNEVLDIEQAQPRAGTSSAGSGGGTATQPKPPATGYDTCRADNATCESCVASNCSPAEINPCLQDAACRSSLDRYSLCLGTGCADSDCFEKLFELGSDVPDCVKKNCKTACSKKPVYSACELYCDCMGANCASKFADTFTSMAACISSCNSLPQDVQTCRRTHCEIAGDYPTEQHCAHATGFLFCGTTASVGPRSCTDKSLNSFACKADSDCCSSHCDQNRRACSDP